MLIFYRLPCWTPLDNGEKGKKEHQQWKVLSVNSPVINPCVILSFLSSVSLSFLDHKKFSTFFARLFLHLFCSSDSQVYYWNVSLFQTSESSPTYSSYSVKWQKKKMVSVNCSLCILLNENIHSAYDCSWIYSCIISYKKTLLNTNWLSYGSCDRGLVNIEIQRLARKWQLCWR